MSALEGVGASVLLVGVVSALLVGTGVRKQPGLGVLAALVVVGLVLWARGDGWAALGFAAPASWGSTVGLALALGLALQVLSIMLVEPLAERLTGEPHDHSVVAGVRGSWKAFGLWMLLVWLVVAPLEEIVFRGFLMTEIARIVGTAPWATLLNVVLASVVFGLAHGYQGRSGIVSTGVVGAVLAWVFVGSGFDLWLAILAHGFVDTVGIALVALGADEAIRRRLRGASA
jgi:membrane protease YdiL (CAAX protease family)